MEFPEIKKLLRERKLAMQALGRSENISEMTNSLLYSSTNTSNNDTKLNKTEYIKPQKGTSINISDLITNETIDLKTTPQKTFFEPAEFSGRSTQHYKDSKLLPSTQSVEEILAGSCDEKIRSIGDSWRESLSSGISIPRCANSSSSKSYSAFNEIDWFICPASSNKEKDYWDISLPNLSQNLPVDHKDKKLDDNFKPAEEMVSQLETDEINWEQEYADIPRPIDSNSKKDFINYSSFSAVLYDAQRTFNSTESNMSIGGYFNAKSEDLSKIMPNAKSPPRRKPQPLIEKSVTSENNSISYENKKDSLLNLSDIKKALRNYDSMNSSDIVNKLLNVKKLAISESESVENTSGIIKSGIIQRNETDIKRKTSTSTHMSDTASFSASMFESYGLSPIPPRNDIASAKASIEVEERTYNVTHKDHSKRNGNEDNDINYSCAIKRRSSSTNRLKENIPLPSIKRSRSPNNVQELKAVSNDFYKKESIALNKTPTKPQAENKLNRAFLSPKENNESKNNSPLNSPYSVASSLDKSDDFDRMHLHKNKSSVSHGKLSLPNKIIDHAKFDGNSPGRIIRSSSQCSSTSEFSHQDATKLPLKSTHGQISWGSVRLRKTEKQTFTIKNVSQKRLHIKFSITGPGFQFFGSEDRETITMQSNECRLVTVLFCPTVIGAATGCITIHHYISRSLEINIPLYAYGGEANIKIEGIQRPPMGQPFICLGNIQRMNEPLEMEITLNNKGSLPGFAIINVNAKSFIKADSLHITPQRVQIPPNTKTIVKMAYQPKRDEIKKILSVKQEVVSLYNITVLTGDEPSRQRVRNQIKTYKDAATDQILQNFVKYIPDLRSNNEQVGQFQEYLKSSTIDAWNAFKENEFVLTVTDYMDETLLNISMNDEPTMLFKTFYSSEHELKDIPEEDLYQMNDENLDFTLKFKSTVNGESWKISPSELLITPGDRNPVKLTIKSTCFRIEAFELDSNFPQLFNFSPKEGSLSPGEKVVIDVTMPRNPIPTGKCYVWIFLENEKLQIPINFKNLCYN